MDICRHGFIDQDKTVPFSLCKSDTLPYFFKKFFRGEYE